MQNRRQPAAQARTSFTYSLRDFSKMTKMYWDAQRIWKFVINGREFYVSPKVCGGFEAAKRAFAAQAAAEGIYTNERGRHVEVYLLSN